MAYLNIIYFSGKVVSLKKQCLSRNERVERVLFCDWMVFMNYIEKSGNHYLQSRQSPASTSKRFPESRGKCQSSKEWWTLKQLQGVCSLALMNNTDIWPQILEHYGELDERLRGFRAWVRHFNLPSPESAWVTPSPLLPCQNVS